MPDDLNKLKNLDTPIPTSSSHQHKKEVSTRKTSPSESLDKYHEAKTNELESLTKLRETYAKKLFNYMCIWSSVVVTILILNKNYLGLDKWVLVALVGGVSVNIFSLAKSFITALSQLPSQKNGHS